MSAIMMLFLILWVVSLAALAASILGGSVLTVVIGLGLIFVGFSIIFGLTTVGVVIERK